MPYYGFGDPMHYKLGEQQQLLEHNRHPIFLGPLVILWAVPIMTYDRLLVALMLPLYVGCGSIINDEDVSYVKLVHHEEKITAGQWSRIITHTHYYKKKQTDLYGIQV